jgi:hypothetical protein
MVKKYSNLYYCCNNGSFVGVTFSLPEYINIKSETNSPKKCLSSVINLLIEKEKQYVLKLKVDLDDLENVSTEACNKLPLMKNILDFHARDLLQCFLYSSDPCDISNLFITYKNKLRLYIIFARTKKDFSYLVMDVCENIIDHFKARLLEYNFTVSEIRSIYINDVEITTSCDEAEKVIKKLYRKINQHLVCEEIQE